MIQRLSSLFLFLLLLKSAIAAPSGNNCDNRFSGVVVAVLVDVSDPFSNPNAMSYEALVAEIVEKAPKHSRVDVYKISTDLKVVGSPLISICKPGPTSDHWLMQGQKYWDTQISTRFTAPLTEVLKEIGKTPVPGKTSPILETIFSISIQSFRGALQQGDAKSKLIVISDFMQHSNELTFYNSAIPDYA
ncbi:MAG: hypothetical protein DA330_10300, partial [Nitrososphaera sp.]|nr:hypothetical protein [Nitrososphaera sp.]